jgi:hypothetical protein
MDQASRLFDIRGQLTRAAENLNQQTGTTEDAFGYLYKVAQQIIASVNAALSADFVPTYDAAPTAGYNDGYAAGWKAAQEEQKDANELAADEPGFDCFDSLTFEKKAILDAALAQLPADAGRSITQFVDFMQDINATMQQQKIAMDELAKIESQNTPEFEAACEAELEAAELEEEANA